jgi:hypothetical protein
MRLGSAARSNTPPTTNGRASADPARARTRTVSPTASGTDSARRRSTSISGTCAGPPACSSAAIHIIAINRPPRIAAS